VTAQRGILFILSAPSGAGKDTLLEALRPEQFGIGRTVSYTTRPRRDYEVDGVHYHFVEVPAMRRMEADGQLIECSEYIPGRFYGTPRQAVEDALASGRDVLIKPEVQGAAKVKEQFPDAVLIFLAPPSVEEATRRMQGRGTETAADAEERIAAMRRELAAAASYDYCVVNETGQLEEAVERVARIIEQERAKRSNAQA